MLRSIETLPADPLLGLTQLFNADKRAEKIDLGVGVFRTPDGLTPVMRAVQLAQSEHIATENTKVYTAPSSKHEKRPVATQLLGVAQWGA